MSTIPSASQGEPRPNTAELLQFLSEHANNPPYIPERDDVDDEPTPAALPSEREAEIREGRTAYYRTREQLDAAVDDLLAELDRVRAENEQLRAEYETASKSYWNATDRADKAQTERDRYQTAYRSGRERAASYWDAYVCEGELRAKREAEVAELQKRVAELEAQVEKLQGLHSCPAIATNLDRCCKTPGHSGDHSSFAGRHIWSPAHAAEAARLHHCTAEFGGPGYTHCELPAGHDGQHESALGNMRRATWGGA